MLCTVADIGAKTRHKIGNTPPFPAIVAVLLFFTLVTVTKANAQPSTDPSAYSLIGTVMAGGFTGAVLGDAKGEQTFYRLYEILPDESKLVKVRSDSILLQRSDGALYEIYIAHDTKTAVQQTAPPVATSPPPPVIAPPGSPTGRAFSGKRHRSRRSSEAEDE